MGTVGKERHSRQKELSEKGQSWGRRWSGQLVVWGMACSRASGIRAGGPGAEKENIKGRLQFRIAMDKCHSENPLHGVTASAVLLKSKSHCLLGSSQPMADYSRTARACPFLPNVGLL